MVTLLVITPSTPAFAAVPVCVLGGPTAMDTNRQLAEGETFVLTDRPLVVNLQFRPTKEHPEQVGECMLPSKSKVAEKNGILQWVAACGNNEVNRSIFVVPFKAIQGEQGIQGLKGDKGDPGPQGEPGRDGRDYSSSQPAVQPQPEQPHQRFVDKKHGHGLLIGGLIGVGAAVGIVAVVVLSHGKKTTPVCVASDPTCIINTGGSNAVGSTGIRF